MRFASAIAAATLAIAGAANAAEPAEPPISNADQIIKSVTAEDLAALVKEMGAPQAEVRDVGNGQKIVVFSESGIPYNMQAAMCDQPRPGKCIAVALVALVDGGTNTVSLDTINNANKSSLYLTMFKLDGSKYGAGNLQLVDGGVTKRNLAVNIASFIITFRDLLKTMDNQTIASNRDHLWPFGNGAYQRASVTAQPRPVVATPQEMQNLVGRLSYATQFGVRR